MIPLTDIPQQYHEALAAERVDVERRDESWTLLSVEPGRQRAVYVSVGTDMRRIIEEPAAGLTLPNTPRNVRALAVVLAGVLRVDTAGGVTARLDLYESGQVSSVEITEANGNQAVLGDDDVPALSTIDTTAQDALLRALVECLRALTETTA